MLTNSLTHASVPMGSGAPMPHLTPQLAAQLTPQLAAHLTPQLAAHLTPQLAAHLTPTMIAERAAQVEIAISSLADAKLTPNAKRHVQLSRPCVLLPGLGAKCPVEFGNRYHEEINSLILAVATGAVPYSSLASGGGGGGGGGGGAGGGGGGGGGRGGAGPTTCRGLLHWRSGYTCTCTYVNVLVRVYAHAHAHAPITCRGLLHWRSRLLANGSSQSAVPTDHWPYTPLTKLPTDEAAH